MDKDEHLIPIPTLDQSLLVAYFILKLEALEGISLGDSDVLHLKGDWAVRMIKEKQASLRFHTEEGGNVGVIW